MSSPAWAEPRELWIDVPAAFADTDALTAADPWLAALLLPAMRQREDLELAGPVSPELATALEQIQTIYAFWLPSARPVEVRAMGHRLGSTRRDGVGLFFSCGVDSWYSLLKSEDSRLVGRTPEVTHLVNVHGVDIDIGEWKVDVARDVARNTRRIAEHFGLEAIVVATNLRHFYSSSGLAWHWGQAGALAAIALLLGDDFRRFLVASAGSFAAKITNADLEAGSCHPLLLPAFSTARCELVVHGSASERLEKVERVVQCPLALETLRVCWASHEPGYNCGRCFKCVRMMLDLAGIGALGTCPTLPDELDPSTLSRVAALFARDMEMMEDRYARLAERGTDPQVLGALREGIERMRRAWGQRERALETIRQTVPDDVPLALLDEDELLYDVGTTHAYVRPFPERNGFFNGLPLDDAAAVDELRRAQRNGAANLVVWKNDFWALDHYPRLREVLDAECQVVASTPEVKVYAISGGR